jgi:hypothetical protein
VGDEINCEGIDFQPIGDENQAFTGRFNGNNVPVIGLTINQENRDYVGLFGAIHSVGITNMVIVDAVVNGRDSVGILVGGSREPSRSALSNNTVSGTVSGNDQVGGLAGIIIDTFISDSSSQVTISAPYGDSVGGLVGALMAGPRDFTSIVDSFSNSTIQGAGQVGGLVGTAIGGDGRDKAVVAIWGSYALGSVDGVDAVGGLIGQSSNIVSINESYAETNVTGIGAAGGLVGSATATIISEAYATGNVTANTKVGGLIGEISYSDVTHAYAVGKVSMTGVGGAQGGLIGYSDDPGFLVKSSFWDVETTRQLGSFGGGMGKTTQEMQTQSLYESYGWNFDTVWEPMSFPEYPQLQ